MKDYDYILFDLDGTLTDSKPGIVECIRHALKHENISYDEAVLDKMVGPPFRVSMHDFLGLEMPMIEKLIWLYRGEYEVYGYKHLNVYDGVRDMLTALKSAGKKIALATSKPIKFTSMIMKEFDLEKYFDFIGGASSDSSKELKCDVINMGLEALGVKDKSKALMVGDRLYDIEGARICSIDSMGVLYGYGSREEFEEYNATYIAVTPQDVVAQILKK